MTDRFTDQRMPGTTFQRVDLGNARFEDVNLHKATFENVNLSEVTIKDANLTGMRIEEAQIRGLTIFGISVSELIEAEFDRRDPERGRLRMADVFDPGEVHRVMARLDLVREEFTLLLRTASPAQLNHYSEPGAWSALEHVRHLVFAEDLYLNRWLLHNDHPWCTLGHLPPFLEDDPAYAQVGIEPTQDLDAVLTAWNGIHARTRIFLAGITPELLETDTRALDFGQGTVGGILQGMARHDLTHIRMAEAALQRARDQETA
jgi:hypothetical protein